MMRINMNKRKLLIALDEEFYNKMKIDKVEREVKSGEVITWGNYLKLVTGWDK
jgi:hypothetical protein